MALEEQIVEHLGQRVGIGPHQRFFAGQRGMHHEVLLFRRLPGTARLNGRRPLRNRLSSSLIASRRPVEASARNWFTNESIWLLVREMCSSITLSTGHPATGLPPSHNTLRAHVHAHQVIFQIMHEHAQRLLPVLRQLFQMVAGRLFGQLGANPRNQFGLIESTDEAVGRSHSQRRGPSGPCRLPRNKA